MFLTGIYSLRQVIHYLHHLLELSNIRMKGGYPKRLFKEGNETEVVQINNSCKMSLLTKIKEAMPLEYDEFKRDPIFAHVFAIHENGLKYSAQTIHSMLCRQLVTKKKHELWFVFGRKPLRFSLQEFYAVTGFNYKDDGSDFEKWTDDKGFWSKLLKRKGNIWLIDKSKTFLFLLKINFNRPKPN